MSMGLYQMIFGEAQVPVEPGPQPDLKAGSGGDKQLQAFENDDYFNRSGGIKNYDYHLILMHKQRCIQQLFELAYYYADADPIVHGIIYHIYVPYMLSSPWQLRGPTKTNKIYEAYYDKIHLADRLQDIAVELATYNNVVVYFLHGVPITLPLSRCRIAGLRVNGEPLVEFDCLALLDDYRNQGFNVHKGWIDDCNPEIRKLAYPEEVIDALNECKEWVQLNPKYCFVPQGPKHGWTKWAVPWISSALLALQQKEIIRKVNSLHDLLIDDEHISAVLQGEDTILSPEVKATILSATELHANSILNQLRELQVDLRSNPAVFIGGGRLLLRPFLTRSPLVARADFIDSPAANALGYQMLAKAALQAGR